MICAQAINNNNDAVTKNMSSMTCLPIFAHMTCSCGNAPCEPQAQPSPHEKCLCLRRLAGSPPGPARGDETAMAQKAKAAKQPGAAKKQGQPAKQPGTPAKQRGKPATRRKKPSGRALGQADKLPGAAWTLWTHHVRRCSAPLSAPEAQAVDLVPQVVDQH